MLKIGNEELRKGNYAEALVYYARALLVMPELSKVIFYNLDSVKRLYLAERELANRLTVAVCGWELSHNAAGRVYTLAQIYQRVSHVEIIGSIFCQYGRELWPPIRDTNIPVHSFLVEDETLFFRHAISMVISHPYDVVHLSKPRASNIIIGVLYKLIWGAKVFIDIDDEELGFVESSEAISITNYLASHDTLPDLKRLDWTLWTRLSVGLVDDFDGITVSNPALKKRYGGYIVRHARDEELFVPSLSLKHKSRREFNIPQEAKVILFFGTPRKHKGLEALAQAIKALRDDRVMLVVVGGGGEQGVQKTVRCILGKKCLFIGFQRFADIPLVVSMADCCLLILDKNSVAARFQVPAKLTDALAMGIPTLISSGEAVEDIINSGACHALDEGDLDRQVSLFVSDLCSDIIKKKARQFFLKHLSIRVNCDVIQDLLSSRNSKTLTCSQMKLMKHLLRV